MKRELMRAAAQMQRGEFPRGEYARAFAALQDLMAENDRIQSLRDRRHKAIGQGINWLIKAFEQRGLLDEPVDLRPDMRVPQRPYTDRQMQAAGDV